MRIALIAKNTLLSVNEDAYQMLDSRHSTDW